ncbi:MAG: hypothetical protein HY749_16050 [Gammaproteobacteria bacterium]|nr:hypothetical protein [Gammaproteobacteria bacterium]
MGAPQSIENDIIETPKFSVELVLPAEQAKTLKNETTALELARVYQFDPKDPEDFRPLVSFANDALVDTKTTIDRLKKLKTGFVQPAKAIIEQAAALFDPAINANLEAEAHYKGVLKQWTEYEEDRVQKEQAAHEAEQRRIRQEAERRAAAERARADQAAADERAKAAEAERERREKEAEAQRLRDEGNAKEARKAEQAAQAAAAEAAKRTEAAAAKVESAEFKATQIELEAHATSNATMPAPVVTTAADFGLAANWVAVPKLLTPSGEMDEGATIKAIAAQIAERPEFVAYLNVNMKAVNKLAKAQKQFFALPGFEAKNDRIARSSRR